MLLEIVHVDQSLTVEEHRTKTIVGNEASTIQGNRTESVTGHIDIRGVKINIEGDRLMSLNSAKIEQNC